MTTLSIWVRLSKNQVYEYNVILDAHYTREREREREGERERERSLYTNLPLIHLA